MLKNNGAAVSDPQGEDVGSLMVTSIIKRGVSGGAKPIKEAIVLLVS